MTVLPDELSTCLRCAPTTVRAEGAGIASVINYTTTSFSYPQNYPFQSASHRWPAPGTTSGWTNITQSLYYSTVVGGQVKVIALNK